MRKRILVVEDNIDHIKRITSYLKRNYIVYVSRYFTDAVTIAEKELPDLIITDWELQSQAGDGITLINILKSNVKTQNIPIIMATAFTSSDKLEQAFDAGCVDYLRKPFSERELLSRVKAILLYNSITNSPKVKQKTKVLLLAANPKDREILDIGREFSNIKNNLIRVGAYRDYFEVNIELNVNKDTLFQLLLESSPNILHFSGHGEEGQIFLHNTDGNSYIVENFHEIINTFISKYPIDCIVLNACNSETIARYITTVPVIGIRGNIFDEVAIDFSNGFYKALASGEDVLFAYKVGLLYANANEMDIILNSH